MQKTTATKPHSSPISEFQISDRSGPVNQVQSVAISPRRISALCCWQFLLRKQICRKHASLDRSRDSSDCRADFCNSLFRNDCQAVASEGSYYNLPVGDSRGRAGQLTFTMCSLSSKPRFDRLREGPMRQITSCAEARRGGPSPTQDASVGMSR